MTSEIGFLERSFGVCLREGFGKVLEKREEGIWEGGLKRDEDLSIGCERWVVDAAAAAAAAAAIGMGLDNRDAHKLQRRGGL